MIAALALALLAQADVPAQEAVIEGERKKEPATESVRGRDAQKLAGAHGDAAAAAQMLPGVAREPAGSGQLVVWGAAPDDTRLLLNGIELPALYHGGGLRSVIPSELVRRLDLSPAAFGPRYGRALGGILAIEADPPRDERPRLRAGIDPIDAHASVNAPLGDARAFAGARFGLLDRVLGPFLSRAARDLFPLPRSWDAQFLLSSPLRDGEEISLIALGSGDETRRSIAAGDPSLARGDSSTSRWGRLGARWKRELPAGARAEAVAWLGDELAQTAITAGATGAGQTRRTRSAGLRAQLSQPLFAAAELTIGADALVQSSDLERRGSLTLPAREGDATAFGLPPGIDVAYDRWSASIGDAALFASAELRFGVIEVSPGLRLSATAIEASRQTPRVGLTPAIGLAQLVWAAEPRLAIAWQVRPALRAFAAAGLHHQPPQPEDLSAVFGTPSLTPAQALHGLWGAALELRPQLSLEATGFARRLDDLAARSPLPTPQLARALVQNGSGTALGAQLVMKLSRHRGLSGFLAYTLSRSDRDDGTANARPFDFDQTHSLTAALSYSLSGFTLGARLRASSGYPRTPIAGAYYDAQQDRFDPIFGARNSARLPGFSELDLRAERSFALGDERRLRVSLEVLNALARKNAEEWAYSFDWSQRAPINGLPPLAILGFEVEL